MKKIILLFMALVLTVLISIPKAYALEMIPNHYNRTNNSLPMSSHSQNANGTYIQYEPDQNYTYRTVYSTNQSFDPFLVIFSDLNLNTLLNYYLANDFSNVDVFDDLNQNYNALDMDIIYFGEYSDDDDRTKLIFPLLQYGGQNYVYVYTKEMVSYQNDSIFIISEVSYNQYMNYLLTSNQVYKDGYDIAKQEGISIGYDIAKDEYGLRGGVYGNANYWFSQGQLSEFDLWGSLLSAFFGVFQVLSIKILPGIELGYFVGFFLVLGVASMILGSFMIRRK